MAQAKINLGLRVLAREASGYHSIETVFVRLALADELTVRVGGDSRELAGSGSRWPSAGLGPPSANLAYRAAAAFAVAAGWPRGFHISVRKEIPVGGGLGGGSADAGATLRALNALAPTRLPEREVLRVAATLGADVPFLTTEAPMALAWGRGERMLRLAPLPERPVALVVPPFAISTRDAYGWVAESRDSYAVPPSLLEPEALASWESLAALSVNDFEPAVARRHPAIASALQALRESGALLARMSGSGSVVYGVFASPPDADAIARAVEGEVIVTRTVSRVVPVEPIH